MTTPQFRCMVVSNTLLTVYQSLSAIVAVKATDDLSPKPKATLMKIRVAPLLTALVLTAALSGCAGDLGGSSDEAAPVGESEGTLQVYVVELPAGEAVSCIASKFSSSIVIPDCDWANIQAASSVTLDESRGLQSYTVKVDGREILCGGSPYSASVIAPDCNWNTESDR
jgi:hypothetical protein